MIVLDDTGFGQLGCFGSDIATPAIDSLAAGGLRYNRFHVTSLCSPTRACLLTGRNHHKVGMGFLTDIPACFPGYNGRIPRTAAAMPRLLKDSGYSTETLGGGQVAPGPELVATAIATALESDGTQLRWPVGQDAELIAAARTGTDYDDFVAGMCTVLNLDW